MRKRKPGQPSDKATETNALAPRADDACETEGDPEDELLQATLREARGEDDPRARAWLEEVREVWWRARLAGLPLWLREGFVRARRALIRAASWSASVRRRASRDG